MAIEEDEVKVVGPQIRPAVIFKFVFFSFLMVATPTAVFFLSFHRQLDCARLSYASETKILGQKR
jgi:hypothetical protein